MSEQKKVSLVSSKNVYGRPFDEPLKVVHFSHDDLDGDMPNNILSYVFGDLLKETYLCAYKSIDKTILDFLDRPDSDEYHIFITDIGIKPEVAEKLNALYEKGQYIVFIDHHPTNVWMNDYDWASVIVERDGKKESGTSLLYEYLTSEELKPLHFDALYKEQLWKLRFNCFIKNIVEVTRKYDTWEWDSGTREERFMLSHDLNMLYYIIGPDQMKEFFMQEALKGDSFTSIPDKYGYLIEIEKRRIDRFLLKMEPTIRWKEMHGKKLAIVYADNYTPYIAEFVTDNYPETDIVVILDVAKNKVSLRTRKEGVEVISFVKLYGGGGHPQAGGFDLTLDTFSDFVTFE